METVNCARCEVPLDDEVVLWATTDGVLNTDTGLPWCEACAPEEPAAHYINAYEVSRLYGGPEEGGWWYDQYEPTGQTWGPFDTVDEAWDQHAALAENAALYNEGRYPLHSVSATSEYRLLVEDHGPQVYPAEAPRYE